MCGSIPRPADRQLSLISSDGRATPVCSSSSSEPMPVGDEVRWKDGFSDMTFPPIPFPSRNVFAATGEPMLRALVQRHHERLRDTSIGHLFPKDDERFAAGVQKAADFMVETTGGPANLTPQAHACMRTRHFPFTIDEAARDIWLAQLLLAMDDVEFPDKVRLEFWNWVEAFSIRMINRRTMKEAPRRYSLGEAPSALQPFMHTPRRAVMCPR